ncbi:MAG: methyltransferase domain-containing protein [Trueperaceae bacterium]|nr:methyltransferase domain-containing protein [Trueperaceae bacterium]
MTKDKAFYDQDEVLAIYLAHRQRRDNPNDALERPVFLDLAGDLRNLDIIDLGCGDAAFGREALSGGARSYLGIELAEGMVQLALENLADTSGKVERKGIEDWQAQEGQADFVVSRLALNYVEHLEPVFREVYKALRPGGRFVVTLEHPVITSHFASLESGKRSSWLVDDYFKSGARKHVWLGKEITKYHHSIEDYLSMLEEAGLRLERLRESKPQREHFHSEAEFQRRLRIPLFLFLAASKPA